MKTKLLFLIALQIAALSPSAQPTWIAQTPEYGAVNATAAPDIQFFGIAKGWALTPKGYLYKTSNGGATWVEQKPADRSAGIHSLSFLHPDTGWITIGNSVYRTQDGGGSWQLQANLGTVDARVFFTHKDTGWGAGRNTNIHQSVNGGTAWAASSVDKAATRDLFFKDGAGWVLTSFDLHRNVNGQNRWNQTPVEGQHALFFTSANVGWMVGEKGAIRKTTDGTLWTPQPSGTTRTLRGVYFLNPDTGWVVGDSGTTLNTTNGGALWTSLSGGTQDSLTNVWFVNARTGWALGKSGVIYRTSTADVPAGVRANGPSNGRLRLRDGKLLYELDRSARVTVTLHALDGRREATLFDAPQAAGAHFLEIPRAGSTPGMRLLSFSHGEIRSVKTLILP